MKYWSGLVALTLILAFLLGLGFISKDAGASKMKQEIACIEAGGQVQTIPYACVRKD